ncbi:dystrobrevin beta-like isoform X2 [Ruditapes philippinarum]|uniref:dystrobrevin beta-like isoform X2 n=1 Tax=Ruditapes philippinarum TaxID=129788 RepID=UPI00295B7AE3|nr:dystrobrevin beta-like isoform X2 [Ruditapes philippinarum]
MLNTENLAQNQLKFANVIQNINRELQEKGFVRDGGVDSGLEDMSPTQQKLIGNRQLITDMRAQNFDVIRFATYRTACKLRYIQKKTNLEMVDIWNIIECFRENGLNTLESDTELNASRVEAILTSLYTSLNKRVPTTRQVDVKLCVNMLLNWLISAYDGSGYGRIKVFSLKVALSHLCSGKLIDKLRYIFTQISDSSGLLVRQKFEQYLQAVLALPTAVFEGPSFGYNETAVRACFDMRSGVNINNFLNVLVSDPGPQCLMWMPILHRMIQVENVFHPVQCDGCHRESFMGFRYRCQRCHNYQLCQDCFWRGRTSGNHSHDHQMKEYLSYKSPAKQIGHSIKKSFHCVPSKSLDEKPPSFPELPEKTVDLSYIVPATPSTVRNGFRDVSPDLSSIGSSPLIHRSPGKQSIGIRSQSTDDEHRLIARYAARLAADVKNAARSPQEMNFTLDTNKAQRELIAQLEQKNREIMREIQRLRMEQEANAKTTANAQYNPTLMAELRLLRQRKDELENRMTALQDSRKDLVMQLEALMKLLKNQPTSPRLTPPDSYHSYSASSPSFSTLNSTQGRSSVAAGTPNTPSDYTNSLQYQHGRSSVPLMSQTGYYSDSSISTNGYSHGRLSAPIVSPSNEKPNTVPNTPGFESTTLSGLEGDVQLAFSQPSSSGHNVRNLRNDLLSAADNITGAMSSLVKELNSDQSGSEDDEDNINGDLEIAENYMMQTREDLESWQKEVQKRLDQETKFVTELRSKQPNSGTNSNPRSGYNSGNRSGYSSGSRSGYSSGSSYSEEEESKNRYLRHVFPRVDYTTDDGESYVRTDDESYTRTDDEDAELYDNHPKELPNEMTSSRHSTEEEGYIQSDAESYIRTDDEDGTNTDTDWEESMKRWINR